MLGRLKARSESGDTIVEVMVVLAVLGLAIGIAYATANRSLLDISQAEENAQATNYAQSEVENLRYLAPTSVSNPSDPGYNSTSNIFKPTGTFCINSVSASPPIVNATPANCMFGTAPYHILIYNCDYYSGGAPNPCTGTAPNSDSFVVQATWPDVLGQGLDSATISYRVHSP
jgi:type II secretory pathway pseudopilin PulG